MEKARKNIRELSIVMLLLAAFSFIRLIVDVMFTDFSSVNLPDGITASVVFVAKVVLCAIGLILLLPQIYVGVKGVKISKTSKISKAAIVWAVILAVVSALAVVSIFVRLLQPGNLVGDILGLCDAMVDVLMFVMYVIYAKKLAKAA